jgi:hypothetical protein
MGMSTGSFAGYLARLDEPALVDLLRARPDVRIEPVPRGFEQLAQRLSLPDSLAAALRLLSLDLHTVGRAIAILGCDATVADVADLLTAPEPAVSEAVGELCRRGLAWHDRGTLHLPERLGLHWMDELGGGRPVAQIAKTVLVDELRISAEALGIEVAGLRKPELIEQITQAMSDRTAMVAAINALPARARQRLNALRHSPGAYFADIGHRDTADPTQALVHAGLVLRHRHTPEVPREVAIATCLAEHGFELVARPELPAAKVDQRESLQAAQAAAQELLRTLTTLLDEASGTPFTALKKGGIGTRERTRLATRLSISDHTLVLCIDLAYAAGLLAQTEAGYTPTSAYRTWRDAQPGRRWAALAHAWCVLDFAPTYRTIDDDKEQPPPLPLASAAGLIRRAMLSAALTGASLRAAGRQIDWFAPAHGYPAEERDNRVTAAIREAELLGVVGADRVCELGEHVLAVTNAALEGSESPAEDPVAELANRCAPLLLPETSCTVILQSDLTAVVSGQPSAAVSRLLALAADNEARGAAGVWRFTPASIRAALDSGCQATDLLAELAAISGRPLPQTLQYLITDTDRRHGSIRVRGMRSCVIAEETMITELIHTRSLTKLHLARLAPTVLSSPLELDGVLATLRAAGFAPVAEDATGTIIVETGTEHLATGTPAATPTPHRARLPATRLAGQLRAEPAGSATLFELADSDTPQTLANLNPQLNTAELALLSDAIDHSREVSIGYRDKNGNHTFRLIRPIQLYGKWLESWCHLRNAEREFTVANIESVAPVH